MKKSVNFKNKCWHASLSRKALWAMAVIFSICFLDGCAEKKQAPKRPIHAKVNIDKSRVVSPVIVAKPKSPNNKEPVGKKSIAKNAKSIPAQQAGTMDKSKVNQVVSSKPTHPQGDTNISTPESDAKNAKSIPTQQAGTMNKSKVNQVVPSKQTHSQGDTNISTPESDQSAEEKVS